VHSLTNWFRAATTVILFLAIASPFVKATSVPKVTITNAGGVTIQFSNLNTLTVLVTGTALVCQTTTTDTRLITVTNSGAAPFNLVLNGSSLGSQTLIAAGVQRVFTVTSAEYCQNLEIDPGTTASGTVNIQ
jgi:hypothetical protein